MLHELEPHEFRRAKPLFQGFDYSLSIHAAIEGNNPGRIFVDDARNPRTALALTVEGYLLAGDDGNPDTNEALRCLFRDMIFTGKVYVNGDWSLSLAVHPDTWAARLPELIPTYEVIKIERYQYLCRAVKFDWRANLPEGYTIRRLDQALLHETDVVFPEQMREALEIEEMWGTEESFFAKGVGFVVLDGREVVACCTSDCVAGDRIDVGIFTHRDHRRRGLATAVVAATVEHCLSHGFRAVGWHCNTFNVASWKTAEKVGFERAHEYAYYYYIYDLIEHLAELGWYYYREGDYARTVRCYERVFALRDENADYHYHLVASAWAHLGDRAQALEYLLAAIDHGWKHIEWTKQRPEFSSLVNTPEWDIVLARMTDDP